MNRCVICNAVSSQDVETNPGEYSRNAFYETPNGDLCFECQSTIDEAVSEFYLGEEEEDEV